MEGSRIGALRLVRELGSGGMGTVYLAEAVRSTRQFGEGEHLAVKVVHPHLLSGHGYFKRFLREAELGNRVRHENVVRTLDVDATQVEGMTIHFMVMEYVDGRTLRELMKDLGFIPDPLLREIARQVSAGLAAIHAEGAVHRDLKPENVLITDDDRIRIMDLGVARLVDESIGLTRGGEFTGSLAYASPEQYGKGELGPKSDLYSLGVVLYELATGRNPFRRDEAAQVMTAHLTFMPPSVVSRNPEASEFISEIATRLLRKEPELRFESAARLHAVLDKGEASDWWQRREGDLRNVEAARPRIPVRRETALHGRDADLAALRSAWAGAVEGDGQAILLDGEAGIGKTRLLDAFVAGIAGEDADVLYGEYTPTGGLGGLAQAIVNHFGVRDLEAGLGRFLPGSSTLVGSFAAMATHQEDPGEGPVLSEEALHSLCCRLMQGLAEKRPLLWIVDDLHFAEPGSRKIALSMARALAGCRVLLVATTRPGGVDDVLGHLSRLEYFRRLELGRLSPREVVELLRDELQSEELADRLGGKIAYKSDGVPFFVFEIIRSLRDGGALVETEDGSWATAGELPDIEVPSSVQDLIQARFVELEAEDRDLLDMAACGGFEFDPDLVIAALDLKTVPALRRLAHLERKHGLIRSIGDRFRFDHHQVQQRLYLGLPPRLRREYHAALAEAIEDAGDGAEPEGGRLIDLVRHHLRGGLTERALGRHSAALDILERGYRNEEALEIVELLLDAGDQVPREERVRLLLRRAGRLHLLGRREEQIEALEEARLLADETGDPALRARAARKLGVFLISVSQFDEAEDALIESERLARGAMALEEEAPALVNRAVSKIHRGAYPEARKLLERGVGLARDLGDRRLTAGALRNLGTVVEAMGDQDRAEEHFRDGLAIARELKDDRLTAMAIGALGGLAYSRGRGEEAREHLREQLRLSLAVGDRGLEIDALATLTAIESALGRLGEAQRHARRALDLSRETGSRHAEGRSSATLGAILLPLGALDEARDCIFAAIEIAAETGSPWSEAWALHLRGLASEQEGGDPAADFDRAGGIYREIGYAEGLAETLLAHGRVHARAGRWGEAMSKLGEALELAERFAIPDVRALVPAYLSLHMDENAEAAREALATYGESLDLRVRMEARYVLWEAVGDPTDLTEAREILGRLEADAPEQYRGSMIEDTPLHHHISGVRR